MTKIPIKSYPPIILVNGRKFYREDKIEELETALKRAQAFYNDIMPQIGKLSLQDYANVNELGMALDDLISPSDSKRYTKRDE